MSTNASRQQYRVRLFEVGKSFHGALDDHSEVVRIAGLCMGPALPEQWGAKSQAVDFFDIKGDVEAVLALACERRDVHFVAANQLPHTHTAFTPTL